MIFCRVRPIRVANLVAEAGAASAESSEQVQLLARLGRYRMGKVCLYIKRLADLDVKVLEALIAGSVAEVNRRYPHPHGG